MIIYASDALKEKVARIATAAQQTFGLESVGDRCFIKPQLAARCVIRITWRADLIDTVKWGLSDVLSLFHRGTELRGKSYVYFCTYHPVSRQGLLLLGWRRILCRILGFLVYFPIAFGIFLPILLLISGSGGHRSAELFAIVAGVIVGSSLLIMGGFRARSFVRRLAQPSSLHAIGDPRIEIYHIETLELPRRAK